MNNDLTKRQSKILATIKPDGKPSDEEVAEIVKDVLLEVFELKNAVVSLADSASAISKSLEEVVRHLRTSK